MIFKKSAKSKILLEKKNSKTFNSYVKIKSTICKKKKNQKHKN